jgi:hypothetical protein
MLAPIAQQLRSIRIAGIYFVTLLQTPGSRIALDFQRTLYSCENVVQE